jgi:hypothetical protein
VDIPLSRKKNWIHPIWRGIGLVMVILIPILSFLIALILVNENNTHHWVLYPAALILKWHDPYVLVKVLLTILLVLILYALFTFITALFYRVFGPPRYGSTDVPPEQIRPVRK